MNLQDIQIDCGVHMANVVIRADAAGWKQDGDRAHARLHALVDAQPDPDAFLIGLARRLGRVRAHAVDITDEVIALATVPA